MTAKELADLLDVIADRAPVLRERGVRRVELGGGVAFTLVGVEPEAPASEPVADAASLDALDDPATFGRPGAGVPARPRRTRTPLVSERDQ